ncbi:expressed unknown protein [Seminavis robusta]|uniref:Uncharacterized protein n=1 Tax=Seminavis robusta TaxID=568900 RepID=A0A9N8EBH4_9STRA|nr:expressed unknown protein [Seminavis robusta]|eukprot:Sro764_g199090.1 n/a (568) ;mRNA; r:37406-39109
MTSASIPTMGTTSKIIVGLCVLLLSAVTVEAATSVTSDSNVIHEDDAALLREIVPPGVSLEDAEQVVRDALASLVESLYLDIHDDDEQRHLLQQLSYPPTTNVIPPCNTLLDTISAQDLKTEISNTFQKQGIFGWKLVALEIVVMSKMNHDLQIWKVCGRCSDFVSDNSTLDMPLFCRPDQYGYEALHSGLLIVPYDMDQEALTQSTRPVNIIAPAAGSTASEAWSRPVNDAQVLIGCFVSSANNAYTLMTDYMGFGESAMYYRAFLQQQSIIIATLPILWQAETIIAEISDCTAAMANAYTLFGYSEGGYGAVAIADALQKLGGTIISLHAGGGPYQVSTFTMLDSTQKLLNGQIDLAFFFVLLGSGLSSTVTSVANYQQGQDFLTSHYRESLIHAVQTTRINRQPILDQIPQHDPTAPFNPHMIALYEEALAMGNADPCNNATSGNVVVNETDKICQALQDLDLLPVLTSANYPIYLCHSRDDQLVTYRNVPPVDANPDYLHVRTVSGRHAPAAIPCILNTLMYFVNPNNLQRYRVQDRTVSGGCAAASQSAACPFFLFDWFGLC